MMDWIRCKNTALPPWAFWVLLAVLAGYGVFIGANHAPVAAGADSGGYLGFAKLLAHGQLTTLVRTVPEFQMVNSWEHAPLGYQLIPGATILRPTYPIGLPLHYAGASLVFGWYWGPLLVSVLAALAVVVLSYLCAREMGVSPVLGMAAAAAVALSPLLLFSSFTPMSDVPATAWCSGAFLAALRSRQSRGAAIFCGVALSIAVLVRPANIILLPALMIVLGSWRNLFWAGLGAMPGALINGAYNQFMWGSPFRSGYGAVSEAFNQNFFLPSLTNYGETLPFALPLMFVGLVLLPLLPWSRWPRELAGCVVWAAAFIGFYAFYSFTSTAWWFLRFIVPAFPALVILGSMGLEAFLERRPLRWQPMGRMIAAILVVAVSLAGSIWAAREKHFMLMKQYQEPYVQVCAWAKQNMPANSLVACMQNSSALFYYTDLAILRWDATESNSYAGLKAELLKTGRPFYAVLSSLEVEEALKIRLPGKWDKVKEFETFSIWKFDPAQ